MGRDADFIDARAESKARSKWLRATVFDDGYVAMPAPLPRHPRRRRG